MGWGVAWLEINAIQGALWWLRDWLGIFLAGTLEQLAQSIKESSATIKGGAVQGFA